MKSYQVLLIAALLVVSTYAGYKNTTDFWATQVADNDLHFQVYSGIVLCYSNRL
jgi:hypothetical protein